MALPRALLRLAVPFLSSLLAMPAAAADLPPPYVSRALDAVLVPVDDAVRTAFSLAEGEQGVLVLSLQPGGVADHAGLVPGDVINEVNGRQVLEPVTLDEIVWCFLQQGTGDYALAGGGKSHQATVTMDSWTEVVDVTTVATWESTSVESFSYEAYSAEYSAEISESYSSAEETIEAEVASDDFTAAEEDGGSGMDPNAEGGDDGGDGGGGDDGDGDEG